MTSVANFNPTRRLLGQVQPGFPLGDNAFEVVFASEPEQPVAVALDVVAIQQSLTPLRYKGT